MITRLFYLLLLAFFLVACDVDEQKKERREHAAQVEPVEKQGATETHKSTDSSPVAAILAKYTTEKVAPHTYVIHGPREMPDKMNKGFMNNPGFIVTDKSVIVIDPGSSVQVGRALVARIKAVTTNPVTHVFNTHVHGDHWLANHGIQEAYPSAKFYAHPEMIEKSRAGGGEEWVALMLSLTENATQGTQPVIPENALQQGQHIKVDDITIKAHVGANRAHTDTDVMYEVVEDQVLFTGDNVTYQRIPRMNDGSFAGNIAVTEYALQLPVNIVVPGHGPTGGKEVLKAYHQYLSILYEGVKQLTEEGLEDFEMKQVFEQKLANFKDWPGFEDELGRHISLAVIEAESEDF